MRVSSSDVKAVRFPVTLRGYAEDEVDALLTLVINTLVDYEQRDAAARAEIDRLRSALDSCRETLATDSRHALADLYREAETRISVMLDEAVGSAERIVREALAANRGILDQAARMTLPGVPAAEGEGRSGSGEPRAAG